VPHNGAGKTPARRIWLDEEETVALVAPVAEKWLKVQVEKAIATSGVEASVVT
jgi:hypothetical protein